MEERAALFHFLKEAIEHEEKAVKSWEEYVAIMDYADPDSEGGLDVEYLKQSKIKLSALRKLEQELKEREING
jgi:hypothetical protein